MTGETKTETKTRPGSEVVFQLILCHLSDECRSRCDITLDECMELYRALVLREAEDVPKK